MNNQKLKGYILYIYIYTLIVYVYLYICIYKDIYTPAHIRIQTYACMHMPWYFSVPPAEARAGLLADQASMISAMIGLQRHGATKTRTS